MTEVKALVLTGFGLNCDYETDFSLNLAGATSHRVHINSLVRAKKEGAGPRLDDFHILVFGGGFSWADDHGAGVLMASKIRNHLGEDLDRFIHQGNLVLGICNGFQALVNLGLLPGFDGRYAERSTAIIANDSGNFVDAWVTLQTNPRSPCVFTRGLDQIDLPVRHGEGKFYTSPEVLDRLEEAEQVVVRYADPQGELAGGRWPLNPNGSLGDIAGICDPTGRVFGLMPHPEAYNHFTNHPHWTRTRLGLLREGVSVIPEEGEGIKIFRNAVAYIRERA